MKLFLFLSMTFVACWAKNTYVVISPAKIRPGMNLSVSVNILSAKAPVTVTAYILQSSTELAKGSASFTAGHPDKLHIQVPDKLPGYSYTLKVEGSGGLTFSDSKTVSVNRKQISLFIQTNKGIYKPGDKVNFRVFATHPDLSMYTEAMDISIYDANSNKIKQWLKVIPDYGVITKEFLLSTQPVLGDWKVKVTTPVASTSRVITVEEYVLPKFEVQVHMPPYAVQSDTDITFTVTSKYTYGKPVEGTLDVSARLDDYYSTGTVFQTSVPTDGDTKVTIPMATLKAQRRRIVDLSLSVVANVTESLTGNTQSGAGVVKIHNEGYKLKFLDSNPKNFKPGLRYVAYLKVSQQDDLPVPTSTHKVQIMTRVGVKESKPTAPAPAKDDAPQLSIIQPYPIEPPETFTDLPAFDLEVPSNGLVQIPLSVKANANSIRLTAKYRERSTSLDLSKMHSASESYLQLSLVPNSAIQVGDLIQFEVNATQPVGTLTYEVLARGAIVATGTYNANQMNAFSFAVMATSCMSPNARIVVYYVRADGEIITDSISFDLTGAFLNKVFVSVNQTDAEPGNTVEVTVMADPLSKAHLLAIDQSVLLLSEGNDVTAGDVYAELKTYDTISSSSGSNDFPPFFGAPVARRKRSIWWPYPTYYGGSDAKTIFENAGVVVITDALVYQRPAEIYPYPVYRGAFAFASASSGGAFQEPTRVRSEFPETWLWDTHDIRPSGSTTFKTTVPDTITSWVTSAFAVHNVTGLGVAPQQAHLKVFKPFFVSLNLPYSVIRGEHLALQAIVFNYLAYDVMVRVTLAQSAHFFNIYLDANNHEAMGQFEAVQEIKVAAGEAKNVYFPIVPDDLGKMDIEVKAQSTQAADAVRRQLLVEAEGVPKEYNIPVLIDLNNIIEFHEIVALTLPPLTVDGSEFMRISAVGDLMGPTLANLDKLLRMPTGCGEQTMLSLAPDVYITDYLKAVNQLTSEIKEKALRFMESGYQRELTYQHPDNSFSAFGKSDKSGSMWLTAFVVRVFRQAREHIFVDDNVIVNAIKWMVGKQNADGSFPEPGRVIHKNMQGNTGSGLGLTIFVYISLVQNLDLYPHGAAHDKALAYLEKEVLKSNDTYFLALAAYAFELAGSTQTQAVLDKLEAKAIHTDGLTHWHQPQKPKATAGTWHSPNPARAIDTEMTAYVLLTYAHQNNIPKGRRILQWIVKQRNPSGGFSSTQDTVVALNALSEFAKLIYSNNFDIHIDAKLNDKTTFSFDINRNNALVMQSRETYSVPPTVSITAKGHGLALLEVSVFFNVESEVEETSFLLAVKVKNETMDHLEIETCVSWLGDGAASGMAVQEIGIPSGFEVKPESISEPRFLKRIEYQDRKMVLYFDEIGTAAVCMTFEVERTSLVAKSQAATVRVYDYYEPDNQMTAFYQPQLLKDSSICEVCKDCSGCKKPDC